MIDINIYNNIVEIIPQEDMIFYVSSDMCSHIKEKLIGISMKQIIFNMKNIKLIDSSGIGVIIHVINNYNANIMLVNMSDQIKKVLKITGVSSLISDSYVIDNFINKN